MEEFICMLSTLFNINKYNYCLKKNSLSGHKFPTLNFLPVSFFYYHFHISSLLVHVYTFLQGIVSQVSQEL